MSLGAPAPALWYRIPECQREQRVLLSSDQCIIDGKHFFLLGRLAIPVHESADPFVWLTWVSVSEANFNRANDLWHTEGRESEPPYFAYVQSDLPYDSSTLSLKAQLITQPLGERPLVELEKTDHPLAAEQCNGIQLIRVQQIVEVALHGSKA
jgi:hypothetical protein